MVRRFSRPMPELTIAFVDLTGSTSVFETLGNDRATKAVTKLTQWIGARGQANGGTVVKMLGDGVLMAFADNRAAVDSMVQIQQEHGKRVQQWPAHLKLLMQIGLARGAVVWVDGDCFGDAVNLASRLSDLAGPEQIFASDTVIHQLGPRSLVRSRNLGAMRINGKVDPCEVFRIEWQADMQSEFLTVPADLHALTPKNDSDFAGIELAWLDATRTFSSGELPLRIGRYGTWVRFGGSDSVVQLRRQDCVLHSDGEISLGAPFSDFSAPTVSYKLMDGSMALARNAAASAR
jgi:adenylate cyclase